jgi:hypothetical protein
VKWPHGLKKMHMPLRMCIFFYIFAPKFMNPARKGRNFLRLWQMKNNSSFKN